jgi:hypothetical protein
MVLQRHPRAFSPPSPDPLRTIVMIWMTKTTTKRKTMMERKERKKMMTGPRAVVSMLPRI